MTFNENNVNRENNGRFGEKNGSPSDVSLNDEANARLDDDGAYVTNGSARTVPDAKMTARLTPDGGLVLTTEEEQAQLSDGERFLGTIRSIGFAKHEDIRLRQEVMDDRAAGKTPIYDNHYTSIWEGNAVNIFGGQDGWSEKVIREKLEQTKQIRADLQNGHIRARDISDNWEKQSDGIAWAKAVETELEDAITSEGRSLFVNAAAARERYQDFEGGRNSR